MGCKEIIYQGLTRHDEWRIQFMTRLQKAHEAPALFSIVIHVVSKMGFDISILIYRNWHANIWYIVCLNDDI